MIPRQGLQAVFPFESFQEAATAILKYLQETVGLGLWLVTRTEGEDWIILSAKDHGYGVKSGDVFRWSDSFCSRMVQGLGPRIAPAAAAVKAYAEAPIGQQVSIGAYVGVPLMRRDGSLFGTLCAIDPQPQPEHLKNKLQLVETLTRLLATVLNSELEREVQSRQLERVEAESQTDPLTGLYNRRGWDRLRDTEEARCRRYGHPAGIVILDLDDLKALNDSQGHTAGDQRLREVAQLLRGAAKPIDIVARIGGDEFAVLAIETRPKDLDALRLGINKALAAAGFRGSVGCAARNPRESLATTQRRADQRMYQQKNTQRRPGSIPQH